jgi:hypothetical protein
MMLSAKAHYDGINAFSETDFTEDLKIINVPTLVMLRRRRPDRAYRGLGAALSKAQESEGLLPCSQAGQDAKY